MRFLNPICLPACLRAFHLYLVMVLWGIGSCTKAANDPQPVAIPSPAGPIVPASTTTFLSLGDSYTIGEGVSETERWNEQMAQLAKTEGIAAPDIIARTGWTTSDLQAAIRAANNQKTYGLVSLLIGVNNQFRGQSIATYRLEFRELLETAVRFASGRPERVVVLSIPDWGRSPSAQGYDQARISQQTNQFNAVAQEECRQVEVTFVDITEITHAAAGDVTQFTPDRLHYSGKHMQQWAMQVLPVVRTMLK